MRSGRIIDIVSNEQSYHKHKGARSSDNVPAVLFCVIFVGLVKRFRYEEQEPVPGVLFAAAHAINNYMNYQTYL